MAGTAEHAKASVSDVGALVKEYRPTMPTEVLHLWAKDVVAALISAQEEAAGLRELVSDMSNSVAEVDDDRKFWKDKATRAESKLADAAGVLEPTKTALEHALFALDGVVSLDDEDEGKDGGSDTCQHAKKTVDRALKKVNAFITSIKETGDAR